MVNDKVKGIIRATTGIIVAGLTFAMTAIVYKGCKDDAVTGVIGAYERLDKSRADKFDKKQKALEDKFITTENIQSSRIAERIKELEKEFGTRSSELEYRKRELEKEFGTKELTYRTVISNEFNAKLQKEIDGMKESEKKRDAEKIKVIDEQLLLVDKVKKENEELKKRREDLEQKFFGTLPTLASQPATNSLSAKERETILEFELGAEKLKELRFYGSFISSLVSDKIRVIGSTHSDIVYKAVPYVENNTALARLETSKNADILILRTDNSNIIYSAHLYRTQSPTNITDRLTRAQPIKEIVFGDKTEVIVVDHNKRELIKGDGINQVAKTYWTDSKEILEKWKSGATNIIREVATLYERGPNVYLQIPTNTVLNEVKKAVNNTNTPPTSTNAPAKITK